MFSFFRRKQKSPREQKADLVVAPTPKEGSEGSIDVEILSETDDEALERGEKFLEQGRYQDAEREFRTALRQNMNSPQALFGLAQVCRELGNTRSATLVLKKLLQLEPNYPGARQLLAELE